MSSQTGSKRQRVSLKLYLQGVPSRMASGTRGIELHLTSDAVGGWYLLASAWIFSCCALSGTQVNLRGSVLGCSELLGMP